MAETLQDLKELLDASRQVGRGMNLGKTKVMFNEHIIPKPVTVRDLLTGVVQEYIYKDKDKEAGRRIRSASSCILRIYTTVPQNQTSTSGSCLY